MKKYTHILLILCGSYGALTYGAEEKAQATSPVDQTTFRALNIIETLTREFERKNIIIEKQQEEIKRLRNEIEQLTQSTNSTTGQ